MVSKDKPLIIYIDDDVDMLHVVSNALKHEGFDVMCTSDPEIFFEYFKLHDVELVIVDAEMPEKTGFEKRTPQSLVSVGCLDEAAGKSPPVPPLLSQSCQRKEFYGLKWCSISTESYLRSKIQRPISLLRRICFTTHNQIERDSSPLHSPVIFAQIPK